MKFKSSWERGQALIVIALSAVVLFGFVALAIDGSTIFSDRRHAQNAADTAALAGALAKVNNDSGWSNKARDRASENGFTGDLVRSKVEVYNPPNTGVYSNCSDVHFDCNDYVQVVIHSYLKTTLASMFGFSQFENRVVAVARTISQNNNFNFGGNSVVALAPTGCSLKVNGSAGVVVEGGGMYSNSDDSTCAFKNQSCPNNNLAVYTDDTHSTFSNITMVGNTTSPCSLDANFVPGATQISFPPPYQEISEPAECSQTQTPTYTVTGTGNSKTATLNPGHYASIPLNGQWKYVILNPGVYCIDTTLTAPTSLIVSGTFPTDPGVFIYIKPGGSFTFNGGSDVALWGINDNSVVADSSLSKYKGFLLYVAPDYSLGTPPNCKINGNSDYKLAGTIYAPYCAITIDGTSNTGDFQSQVIGYTVTMAGTADVKIVYNTGSNATFTIPMQVGLSK